MGSEKSYGGHDVRRVTLAAVRRASSAVLKKWHSISHIPCCPLGLITAFVRRKRRENHITVVVRES
jgi:hypothetical protein